MDVFRIITFLATLVVWIFCGLLAWAMSPYLQWVLTAIRRLHDFAL